MPAMASTLKSRTRKSKFLLKNRSITWRNVLTIKPPETRQFQSIDVVILQYLYPNYIM